MDKQKIFVGGMYFKRPTELTKEKAPWVKGHVSIKTADFKTWFATHTDKEWVNITLKESKDKSKLYFEEDNWTPKDVVFTPEEKAHIENAKAKEVRPQETGRNSDGSLPPNFSKDIDAEEAFNSWN